MVVAFVGHRTIENYEVVKERLTEVVIALIENESADTFMFGSVGDFSLLCYEVVSELREKYPHIRRVYVRAEYDVISEDGIKYFYSHYEDMFFSDKVLRAGARSYVVRNQVMVDMCDVLVTHCDVNYQPPRKTKSGTQMAVAYALKKNKRVINIKYNYRHYLDFC